MPKIQVLHAITSTARYYHNCGKVLHAITSCNRRYGAPIPLPRPHTHTQTHTHAYNTHMLCVSSYYYLCVLIRILVHMCASTSTVCTSFPCIQALALIDWLSHCSVPRSICRLVQRPRLPYAQRPRLPYAQRPRLPYTQRPRLP
jgi:hypothetical protein